MDQDRNNKNGEYHTPVLVDEVARLLAPVMPGVVIDATFGGGGHSRRLLDEFGEDVSIIGIDRDPDALANAGDLGVVAVQGNFADLGALVAPILDEAPAGILFDFGVSSHQLDEASRGFSYRFDGPLDMRMGPDTNLTAARIVNEWDAAELIRMLREYGEEPLARRYASAIVRARPIKTTAQLSTVIAEATPAARRRAGHPARRTFQAIRIAVNAELDAVRFGIDQAIEIVRPGGRVVAISYHSLEDRIVKQRFVEGARGCTCPPDLPVCGCGTTAELRVLTRKPIRASDTEIAINNRARSAVLRCAERLAA
ncbi:MAG: 16S rRNA (cytosine(1402)-N(4))-methyltransferase RsmH [Actinomycetota bacterium]|nr:16S rRNA (cytosine(1402)-N(4))-methyltransferase RsmH [Actinomycetota bacterium]